MPTIHLETSIHAPITRCFDLSRSIDLHKISTVGTHEESIAGVTHGLIGQGESVTWRAKHFGIYFTLTSKITACEPPYRFVDEQVTGPFQSFRHVHLFEEINGATLMKDEFQFTTPFGILGRLVDALFLKRYMHRFLEKRNETIKAFAASARWKEFL